MSLNIRSYMDLIVDIDLIIDMPLKISQLIHLHVYYKINYLPAYKHELTRKLP